MKRALATKKFTLIAISIVIIVGGSGILLLHEGNSAPSYRTGTVTTGAIQQTLSITGNLTPVSLADVAFATAGTVTSVKVNANQTVRAGQALATLDPTTAQSTLVAVQDALASAQTKLQADQASFASPQAITQAQQLVTSDGTQLTDDTLQQQLTQETNAQKLSSDNSTIGSDASNLTGAQSTYTAAGCSANSTSPTCKTDSTALAQAQSALANAKVSLATDTLSNRESLNQAEQKVASDHTSLSTAKTNLATTDLTTPASDNAQIAQDEASVAQAQATVTQDQKSLNETTLTSPISGIVATVAVAVGDVEQGSTGGSAASAAASTNAFVILNPNAFELTGTISDSEIDSVATGQPALVTASGSANALSATVTSVGVVGTVSSGVATFPVTVTVSPTEPQTQLRDGMSATGSIILSQVVNVLVVPTSAVHTNGATSTVDIIKDGKLTPVTVTTGASDSTDTQISSGLTDGESIVISIVTSTIPTTSTGSTSKGGFPLGGGGTRSFTGGGGGIPVGG